MAPLRRCRRDKVPQSQASSWWRRFRSGGFSAEEVDEDYRKMNINHIHKIDKIVYTPLIHDIVSPITWEGGKYSLIRTPSGTGTLRRVAR